MKDISHLRQLVWNHFSSSTPKQLAAFKTLFFAGANFERAAPGQGIAQPIIHFSEFNEEHLAAAKAVWTELFLIANDATQTDADAVDQAFSYLVKLQQNPDLKNYALMVFITHNERAKRILQGTIPGLNIREPQKVLPSNGPASRDGISEFNPGGTTDPKEDKLNYFREDPAFNEHHERWHVVYPNGGIPYVDQKTKDILYRERDRHGEMFIYMHQQMIAHYDANRLAHGLERVVPFDFSTPIAVGYDPGTFLQVFGDSQYSPRKSNWTVLPQLGSYTVGQQLLFIDRMRKTVASGFITLDHKRIRLNADLLGLMIESLGKSVEKFGAVKSYYGNVHNLGHNLISNVSDTDVDAPLGVMSQTATAVRDPIFFRWHKQVDDFNFTWQETKAVETYADAPDVLIRAEYNHSPDIIICRLTDLARIGQSTGLKEYEIGQIAFGGDHWNTDFSEAQAEVVTPDKTKTLSLPTLSEIQNFMQNAELLVHGVSSEDADFKIPYQFLNHRRYGFFIRLENLLPVRSKVTVRMFMVPSAEVENRRMWIELDKFVHELEPFSKHVVFRRDTDSSIVRKPAILNPEVTNAVLRPLAMTDIEFLFANRLSGVITFLKNLIALQSGDPLNAPSLKDDLKLFQKRITEASSPREEALAVAAFANILDKYYTSLSIAWHELRQIKYRGFEDLFTEADTAFTQTVHARTLGDVIQYFKCIHDFISKLISLLEQSGDTMEPEINEAMLHAHNVLTEIAYCECGLPYNLLYPIGTAEGVPYILMVMVTDWNKDITSEQTCCGSMSYCGTKGTYPDIKEMGYPFHRPFANGILNTFAGLDNVACRSFNMKLIDQPK